jgi:hypothetical protein
VGTLFFDENEKKARFHNVKFISDGTNWYDLVVEPANKFTYLAIKAHNIVKTKKSIGRIKPSFYYLEQDSVTFPFYILLPVFLPYSTTFVKRIDELISNGLIKKFTDEYWPNEERYDEEVELQVLSVFQLRLGFVAFLICLAFSAGAFIVELTVKSVLSLMSRNRKVKFKTRLSAPKTNESIFEFYLRHLEHCLEHLLLDKNINLSMLKIMFLSFSSLMATISSAMFFHHIYI